MRDSKAWVPLAWLPLIVIGLVLTSNPEEIVNWIVLNLGRLPATIIIVLFAILAGALVIKVFQPVEHERYEPPSAMAVGNYKVRVFGNVEVLQQESFRIAAIKSWTHVGYKEWVAELDSPVAHDLAQAINSSDRFKSPYSK